MGSTIPDRPPPVIPVLVGLFVLGIDVKAAYGLWLSRNEKRAMQDVLARC